MVDSNKFITNFIKCTQDKRQDKLKLLEAKNISDIVVELANNKNSDCLILWNAICEIEDEKKLFKIIEEVLPKLNRDALSLREYQDFINRFLLQLPNKSLKFSLKVSLLCSECLKIGDQRAPFWKDILPLCLKILQKNSTKVLETEDNESTMTGKEAANDMIKNILKSDFALATLTTLMSMFKDIEISPTQQDSLVIKVCGLIEKVNHEDIGNLSLVIFQQANYNQIIMPLLALDKYFYKRRYRFLLNEYESAPDDIEETSSVGLVHAEETTIYHFQNVAEFTNIEKNIATALKALEFTPHFVLSPFLSTILVSIAKISSSVQGNFRLNQSTILPFMKQVFKFNEEHRQILKFSGWAKSIDPIEAVNTDSLLRMLKENTCSLRQDVALNGLFGLVFLLLKTKASPALNKFAIDFLNDIIKNRTEFTSDILRIVVKMLFCEKNKGPIIECFSSLVQNRHLDVSASEMALQKLIEDLPELDLDTALSIESVIFTAITKSISLRDLMIEVMKKAMYQRNVEIRKMAIFSFCIMLRKFTKPSSRLSASTSTQSRFSHNISMFSLTQSQIAISANSNRNNNIRQVEIIMLEILGLLRKCFSENNEIKVMLYESLLNSIQANSFIVSNVFEFLNGHFRMYFDCDEEMLMDFDKLFKQDEENDDGNLIIMDDLGQLLKFMISCIVITKEHHQKLNCDVNIYEEILSKLIEKCINATKEQLHVFSNIDQKNFIIMAQFLNCCEALMLYCYYQITTHNNEMYVTKVLMLFEKYLEIQKEHKKMLEASNKKSTKSDKKAATMPDVELKKSTQKMETRTKCIWNLKECVPFLKAIFNDNQNERMKEFKQNKDFCHFVLMTTSQKLAELETSSEHSKMKYSRSIFDSFLSCSTIFYQQLHTDNFISLHNNYSSDCAASLSNAFKYLIQAMETTFTGKSEKFNQFLKSMTQTNVYNNHSHNQDDENDSMLLEVIKKIHQIIEWIFEQEKKSVEFIENSSSITLILNNLFTSLQLLYRKFNSATISRECFNWILNFAKKTNVKNKSIAAVVIKLFIQCINQHENALLIDCVAHKIASCYQYRRTINEPECASQNNFAIITKQAGVVDEAFSEFIEFIKDQILVVEIYIKRSNSFNAHAQLRGQESHDDTCTALQSLATAICTKVISLGKSIERIASCKFQISTRNIERVAGIIKLYYNCLVNLMKHFRKHHDIKNINCESIGLENLIKYSKKFAACVYSIAPYIENAAEEEFDKGKKDDLKARTKKRDAIMNKETKTIPRMIFLIETFNTQVLNFDAAAKTTLSKHLHPGEVRDFHIENKLLRDAIVRSQASARSQTFENDDDDDDVSMNETKSNETQQSSDNENIQPNKKRKRRLASTTSSSSSTNNSSDEEENNASGNESSEQNDSPPKKAPKRQQKPTIRVRLEKNARVARGREKRMTEAPPKATGKRGGRKKK